MWLIALWLLILAMTLQFRRAGKAAAVLQFPYLLWVAFAGYLNAGAWFLKKKKKNGRGGKLWCSFPPRLVVCAQAGSPASSGGSSRRL